MKKKFFSIFLFLLLAVCIFADSNNDEDLDEATEEALLVDCTEIDAGRPLMAKIDLLDGSDYACKTFSFDVSDDVFAVELSISDALADLDLFVYRDEGNDSFLDADYLSETDFYNESLFISRVSNIPLETGRYYVEIQYQFDYLPQVEGKAIEEVDFSLSLREVLAKPAMTFKPGKAYNLKLEPENGMFNLAKVKIPNGTRCFRVDVFDTNADVDVFAGFETPAMSRTDALYMADSALGNESLVVGDGKNRLKSGTYYLTFIDLVASEVDENLSVIVTLGKDAPEKLTKIPNIPGFSGNFDAAVLSTVDITASVNKGSGCLVSSKGHILTNYHVVLGPDEMISENIYVGFSLSNDQPPKELFMASVIDFDIKNDLALLKIDKGRYGQALPNGIEFPYFSIGDSKDLGMGQPIGVIGYPDFGGVGSRSTATFTKGVICGFELVGGIQYLKTNALISGGNSGGAVINAYYELLGLPCFTVGADSLQMGYIFPINSLPDKWFSIIRDRN